MRYLVTGGAGFLGSYLRDRLIDEGHEVLCVDNLNTGSPDNISHQLKNHKFELIRHTVTLPLFVEVDATYYLACLASPIHYQKETVATTKTSVIGSVNMVDLA